MVARTIAEMWGPHEDSKVAWIWVPRKGGRPPLTHFSFQRVGTLPTTFLQNFTMPILILKRGFTSFPPLPKKRTTYNDEKEEAVKWSKLPLS